MLHRWIGIASCLLFVMWFVSGLVMIYVPYPSVSEAERVSRLAPIEWTAIETTVPSSAGLREVALEMRDQEPVWRLTPWTGQPAIVSAKTGLAAPRLDQAAARRIAERFLAAPVLRLEHITRDQWTVNSRLDPKRPLWKASFGDTKATEVYVSSVTGEVVQSTQRTERLWNWFGSVPHWLYPTILRQNRSLWRQVVLWVAGPCMATALTGIWIGILRMRAGRRRYKNGRVTPYEGWMLWHHVTGLLGGAFLLSWIFSGWLSVDPGRVFANGGISAEGEIAYRSAGESPPLQPSHLAVIAPGARRVEFEWFSGRPLLRFTEANEKVAIVDGKTLLPATIDPEAIHAAAARLVSTARVANVESLATADAYWYSTDSLPPLPVIRVRFDDVAQTWVHIDPRSGAVEGAIDQRGRLYRWLFDLLHRWDLNILTSNPTVWKIALWVLMLPGLLISISGAWIGWKRLSRSDDARRSGLLLVWWTPG